MGHLSVARCVSKAFPELRHQFSRLPFFLSISLITTPIVCSPFEEALMVPHTPMNEGSKSLSLGFASSSHLAPAHLPHPKHKAIPHCRHAASITSQVKCKLHPKMNTLPTRIRGIPFRTSYVLAYQEEAPS